jgi:membrane protease subunit (stomatin/prohibitin family)
MDQTTALVLLIAVAVIGIGATMAIMRRNDAAKAATDPADRPFAASTEGMKRCPNCGVGNLVTESNCSNCGKRLS